MFYVVVLKTDTPNKAHAIHLTKLPQKYRQKAVFQSFMKNHSDSPKEYYVESLEKKGKPRNFYSKKAAQNMVFKLAEEQGYFVRLPKNTWGVYKKIQKVRKQPANKQYPVDHIPAEDPDLREFVLESVEDGWSIDAAAKLMFKRNIPVFSMKTRNFGVKKLFRHGFTFKLDLIGVYEDRWWALNRKRGICNPAIPGMAFLRNKMDRINDWDHDFAKNKKNVNEICAQLTKLYSKTPGSRAHTVDAVEPDDIKTTHVIKVI